MHFVHPQYLFFLFAVIVPFIVHLFKLRRYKREYFSNVRLLKQIQQEQKKSAQLREYLVLACRILTIACLVLAFAQPYVPKDEADARGRQSPHETMASVYLDNSFSMQAPTVSSMRKLDQAKAYVRSILEKLPPDASVQVITNDLSGQQQQFRQPSECLESLDAIESCPFTPSFEEIQARQQALFEAESVPESARTCYYVSDFQKSVWPMPQQRRSDSMETWVFVPVEGRDYANVSLDSVALESPVLQAGREIGLHVFLQNHSDKEQYQMPLRLFVDGRQIGAYPVDLGPGELLETRIPFRLEKAGIHTACVEVADYPVEFDNGLYFSLNLTEKLPVLHLYSTQASAAVAKVFQNDSSFLYRAVDRDRLDYSRIESARLVVVEGLRSMPSALESALAGFVRKGGSLFLIPEEPVLDADAKGEDTNRKASAASFHSASDGLLKNLIGSGFQPFGNVESPLRWINREHPIFSLALEDVDRNAAPAHANERLPYVKAAYGMPDSRGAYVSLMSFRQPQAGAGQNEAGRDFLRAYAVGSGWLYLLAAPLALEYSDFTSHYTFVVSLLNMALCQGGQHPIYYTLGSQQTLYLPSYLFQDKESLYHIYSMEGGFDFMPEIRRRGMETVLLTHGELRTAGNYGLAAEPAGSEKETEEYDCLWPLSFNYSRVESGQDSWDLEELKDWVGRYGGARTYLLRPDQVDMSESLARIERGKELWKVFLIFALVFALVETIALRRTSLH